MIGDQIATNLASSCIEKTEHPQGYSGIGCGTNRRENGLDEMPLRHMGCRSHCKVHLIVK